MKSVSMSLRRGFLALGSITFGVLLIALLIRVGKIDWRLTVWQLQHASLSAFVKLVLLNVVLVYLSSKKWRSVDAALRHSSDSVPSRVTSFAVTSSGMALGLIIPVQLGMTAARTLGTYAHGRTLKRGTAGTLFEQSFDLLVVAFLGITSGIVRYFRGGGLMWTTSAIAMTALALLVTGPTIEIVRRLSIYFDNSPRQEGRIGKIQQSLSKLQHSGVLNSALAHRLLMLSAARFAVIVLMAGQTAEAVGAPIPLWRIAAAIPFVVIASLIAITPGGLGVNELTYAAALNVFGTPFSIGAQWALANRVLGAASCFLVVVGAACLLGIKRFAPINRKTSIGTGAC